jgi:hypothetical protein
MKNLAKIAAAAGVLSLGAVSPSWATLILPSTGNSSAALTILDTLGQRSIVVTLTTSFNDLLPSLIATEAGFSIANAIGAADRTEVANFLSVSGNYTWWVSAADSNGLGSFGGRQVMTTGTPGLSSVSYTNQGVTQAANAANAFYTGVNNTCGTDNSCQADAAPDDPLPDDFAAYAGQTNWGARWGSNLPPSLANGATIGTAQGFYLFATPELGTAVGALQATRTNYQNSSGSGLWNLNVVGGEAVLSYVLNPGVPPVPLPAAAWLLMSGLLGFATVARRKQQAQAAA